jgi:hypothetical protein
MEHRLEICSMLEINVHTSDSKLCDILIELYTKNRAEDKDKINKIDELLDYVCLIKTKLTFRNFIISFPKFTDKQQGVKDFLSTKYPIYNSMDMRNVVVNNMLDVDANIFDSSKSKIDDIKTSEPLCNTYENIIDQGYHFDTPVMIFSEWEMKMLNSDITTLGMHEKFCKVYLEKKHRRKMIEYGFIEKTDEDEDEEDVNEKKERELKPYKIDTCSNFKIETI